MNDFLAFLRDLTHNRNFHLFAIGVHLSGLAFFAWAYSVMPSKLFLFFMGWCVWYGVQSSLFVMRGKGS